MHDVTLSLTGVHVDGEVCDVHMRPDTLRAFTDGAFRLLDPFALVYVWPKGSEGPTKQPGATLVPGYWYAKTGAEALALAQRFA